MQINSNVWLYQLHKITLQSYKRNSVWVMSASVVLLLGLLNDKYAVEDFQ